MAFKRTSLILLLFLALLSITSCFCPHNYLPSDNPPPLPPFSVPEKIRVALVLGSGGVRGMAHVGVLEEFEKAGIPIDIIIGCSAGSLVGALYADNPHISSVKKAIENMHRDTLLNINLWDSRFGLCQGSSFRRVLNENLKATCFEELKIPMVIVATDLHTGELVPLGSGDVVKAVQASCAIPFVFVPVELYGRIFVDGGTINPVPICVAKDLGAQVVIAVDLCELLPKTFPTNLFGVAKRSAEIAFLWQNEVCTRNADVIIRPKMCNIGCFNEKAKSELYEAGRVAAIEAIPRIKEILELFPDMQIPSTNTRVVQLESYHP